MTYFLWIPITESYTTAPHLFIFDMWCFMEKQEHLHGGAGRQQGSKREKPEATQQKGLSKNYRGHTAA